MPATIQHAWRKWADWCDSRDEDPFSAPLGSFLAFLAHQFALGREYRSLNVYRSAISSTYLPVDGFPIKQHPLVSRLLKEVFNSRPPQPKYSGTWDISLVLDYLSTQGKSDSLTLSLLTKKLAMQLALVSAQRSSDLVTLSLPAMQKGRGVSTVKILILAPFQFKRPQASIVFFPFQLYAPMGFGINFRRRLN